MVYLAKPPPSQQQHQQDNEANSRRRRSRVLSPHVVLRNLAEREGLAIAYAATSLRRLGTVQTTLSALLTTSEATVVNSKDGRSVSFQMPGWKKPAFWQFVVADASLCVKGVDAVVFDNCPVEEIDRLLPALSSTKSSGSLHVLVMLAPDGPQQWEYLSRYYQERAADYDIKYIS